MSFTQENRDINRKNTAGFWTPSNSSSVGFGMAKNQKKNVDCPKHIPRIHHRSARIDGDHWDDQQLFA